jgi:glycosyltransferase involved in cell wall biosynthesis
MDTDRMPSMTAQRVDNPPTSQAGLPKVTVVTVVLNAVDLIERTLQSVISQDYPNLEYIVIDGLSTDGTLELVQKYRQQITTIVSGKDGGIYPAMNKGAAMATGEWILFQNAGDFFVDNGVITRSFSCCNWAQCDVIYGDSIYVYEGYRWVEHAEEHATMHDGLGFCHQSAFLRTALQREYGLDVSERVAADYDLGLRLLKAGKVFKHVDVLITEFLTGGFSALAPSETIRLRHRVYTKYFPRSSWVMYAQLARLRIKHGLKALVPARAWAALKRLRDRGRALPAESREPS